MQSCDHCKFGGVKLQGDKSLAKVCRRHPPHVTVQPVPQGGRLAMMTLVTWPNVEDDDWCGEFAPKLALTS